MKTVWAEARTNIALVKYWGKCDPAWNLPAVPSLSLTLDGLRTRTAVRFEPGRPHDELLLGGAAQHGVPLQRVTRHLDRLWRLASPTPGEPRPGALVQSHNNFPTAAGLASSASAFAALTVAAAGALGLDLSPAALSVLARQGSGSAARSIFGGLVVLGVGTPGMPDSAQAAPLLAPEDWPELRMVIGVVTEEQKATSSTKGMDHTAATSPYYAPFVAGAPAELAQALGAVRARDIEALGRCAERSALRMHASAMAADPAVVYLAGATIEGLHSIRALQREGVPAYFTCDAGPHPKALTLAVHAERVAKALQAVPGVRRTLVAAPGAGARLIDAAEGGA